MDGSQIEKRESADEESDNESEGETSGLTKWQIIDEIREQQRNMSQEEVKTQRRLFFFQSLQEKPRLSADDLLALSAIQDPLLRFEVRGVIFTVKQSSIKDCEYLVELHANGDVADMDPLIFASLLEYISSRLETLPQFFNLQQSEIFAQLLRTARALPSLKDFPESVEVSDQGFCTKTLDASRPVSWRFETESGGYYTHEPSRVLNFYIGSVSVKDSYNVRRMRAFDESRCEPLIASNCSLKDECGWRERVLPHCLDHFCQRITPEKIGKTWDEGFFDEFYSPSAHDPFKGTYTVQYYDYHPAQRLLVRRQRNCPPEAVLIMEKDFNPEVTAKCVRMSVIAVPYGFTFTEDSEILGIPPALFFIPADVDKTTPQTLFDRSYQRDLDEQEHNKYETILMILGGVKGFCLRRDENQIITQQQVDLLREMKQKKDRNESWIPPKERWIVKAKPTAS